MSSMNSFSVWPRSGNLETHSLPERPPHPALRILTQQQTLTTTISPASIDPVKLSSSIPPSPHDFESPSSDTSSSDHTSPEGGTLSDQDLEHSEPQQQAQVKQEGEPVPRRGDPTWVARPRNPFIIFRCEYSQKNCREGKRIRRPSGAPPEKSLSKRAAEAWYVLPEEEKIKYKELADIEREKHAKMYPQYRFRPAKRGMKTRRTALQEQEQQQDAQFAAESMLTDQGTDASQELNGHPVLANPIPSFDPPLSPNAGEPILISPITLPSQAGHGVTSTAAGGSMSGQPRADLIKANRRRSCSQPIPLPRHLCEPGTWRRGSLPTIATAAPQAVGQVPIINVSHTMETDADHRPEFKRSRSATGSWSMPVARHTVFPHGSGTPYEQYSDVYTSGSASPQTGSRSPGNVHVSFHGAPQRSFASSSSSLANWNREVEEPFVPSPSVHSASSASSSPWMTMATLNISSSATASPLNSPGHQQLGEYISPLFVPGEPVPAYFAAENDAGMQGIYTPQPGRCNTSTTLTGIGEENIGDYMTHTDMLQCSGMTDTFDLLSNPDFAAAMYELNSTTTSLDHDMVPANAVHGDPAFIQRGQYGPNDEETIPLDLDKYLHSF